MKTRPATRRQRLAFTLIELITVIAIIMILMGLLVPVIMMGRETGRRAKASAATKTIVSACKSYSTDYGKYPPVADALEDVPDSGSYHSYGDTETAKCKVPNNQLFDVLRAIARGSNEEHRLNRRKQSYFEEKKATDPRDPREGFADGKEFADAIQGQLLDPWGRQFCIILDADGDAMLGLEAFFQDLTDPIRESAVGFSMAKNNAIGGKGYPGRLRPERSTAAPDDLVSWE